MTPDNASNMRQIQGRLVACCFGIVLLGLLGFLILMPILVASRREALALLDEGDEPRGRWFIQWGYLLTIPLAFASTMLLFWALT